MNRDLDADAPLRTTVPAEAAGRRLDQVLAEQIGGDTRFPFLPLSIYDRGWGCSWNSRGVAIPPLHDEAQIFDKLFGEEDLSAKRQRITDDQEVVRALYRDMEQLQRRGGNRAKIDSYRSVIAELEAQLKHEEFWLNTRKPEVPNTLSDDGEFPFSTKVNNLLELSKLAFQTDSTRVISIVIQNNHGIPLIDGVDSEHHNLSHHGRDPARIEQLKQIERAILGSFDGLLTRMKDKEENGISLLDSTCALLGSNLGNAAAHDPRNNPILLAGGGMNHGSYSSHDSGDNTPLGNLFVRMLKEIGIETDSFSTSSGLLDW